MDIRSLIPFGLAFGTVVILLSIVSNIVQNIATDQCSQIGQGTLNCTKSLAYNISIYGLNGNNSLASQLPTIGLVLGAAVIIGTLVMAFAFREQ